MNDEDTTAQHDIVASEQNLSLVSVKKIKSKG